MLIMMIQYIISVIIQIKMNFKNTRRPNKTISPLMERNVTPDILSKYNVQSTVQSSNIPYNPVLKQFTQSPVTYQSKPKNYFRQEDYMHCSLSQLNLQLDNNMNQIVFLLGKRKNLTNAKKKRLREEMQEKLMEAKNTNINNFQYMNDDEFAKIVEFCPNTNTAIKIISKIIQLLPEMRGPRADQQEKSQTFWNTNRQIQNQIDEQLAKLKTIEGELQNENKQVIELCKTLDQVQDKLKSIAGMKSEDHLQKVQPLFYSKKLNYDQLNNLVNNREKEKDRKILSLKKLIEAINHLKRIRQCRMNEIAQFFGLDNVMDFDKYNFREAGDFGSGFQELIKLKQKSGYLELSEKQIESQLDKLSYEQQELYSNILKRQSDEARAFHEYTNVMLQRVKYASIMNVFGSQMQQILSLNETDIFRKFKQYKGFLKKFIEEEGSIKLGLIKTRDTSVTFQTLLKATENEKQRRQQVLNLLEACLRKRGDYEHKKEDIRNLMIQMTKNEQLLSQYQEELQGILSDGDINAYKTIGSSIGKCEQQKCKLLHMKQRLQKEMDLMDRQVVGLANKIQGDYEDILRQVIPSDYQYSLTSSDDVKKLRNHLRKMYKRLGILKNQ